MKYPETINRLIEHFMKYPGIGKKTAERYAIYTVNNIKEDDAINFAKSLVDVKRSISNCSICGHITDVDPCYICTDETRDKSKILVVEEAKDVISLEKVNEFNGKYHVLNGAISPLNGIGPEDINISGLLERLKDETIKEVIIATNANLEGESTALYINRILLNTDILVTRIAHGLPVGSNLEYADEVTLLKALEGRRKF